MERMQKPEERNETIITEFILHGFGDLRDLQIPLFVVFLVIYIMTIVGNLIIVVLVVRVQHLRTPMYFFLGNLSCLEICYSSTILPRMLASFLTQNQAVSIYSCFLQLWAFAVFAAVECYLLAAMSYDRYLAICRPLYYSTLMNLKICLHLVAGSWIGSFVINTASFLFISQLSFCGHNVNEHFFCDFTPLINLACSGAQQVKLVSAILASFATLPPFILTVTSYVYIIAAILRIPSATGRQKAFSTCSAHFIVVTIFYDTLTIVYVLPDTNELKELNKVFSVFYTILTPLVNPLIYSLRNKEVKEALRKSGSQFCNSLKSALTSCFQIL